MSTAKLCERQTSLILVGRCPVQDYFTDDVLDGCEEKGPTRGP